MGEIVEKPWGTYEVLASGDDWLTKKIIINPGHRTSLQSHRRRKEFWNVVEGKLLIDIYYVNPTTGKYNRYPDYMILAHSGARSIEIPVEAKHRMENEEDVPVVIIETQYGHCDEEDIIRYADDYDRE